MMTIRELCEKHTSLAPGDIEKIENMARTIPYLANLEDADIFIDCLLPSGDAIVVAEANPKDSPSSYQKSVVGMIAYQENEPAVARTFQIGVATKHMKALTQENARVIQSVEPISNGTEIIGVLIREKRIEEQFSGQNPLHLSHEKYETMAKAMTSKRESWLAECIDEALLIVDNKGIVCSANEVACQLYRRLGYVGELIGQRYENVQLVVPQYGASDEAVTEASVGKYFFNIRHVKLETEELSCAVIIRDETEEKQREQELVLKSVAVQEMHHRVKNNLQTIAALLRLQIRRSENPETIQVLRETMNRILSISATHELLAKSGVDLIMIGEVLKQIRSNVLQNFEHSGVDIEIRMEAGDFETDSDIAASVAMVVNELLQNSMKYAFEGKEKGLIEILVKKGELYSNITVRDDGIGFDADISRPNHLGWGIVRSLVKDKLHGTIHVESGEQGSAVTFDFLNQNVDTLEL